MAVEKQQRKRKTERKWSANEEAGQVIRELKTRRLLTNQIWVIQIYDAMTFLKVYELFSLCSRQLWMFLQLMSLEAYYEKGQSKWFLKKFGTSGR